MAVSSGGSTMNAGIPNSDSTFAHEQLAGGYIHIQNGAWAFLRGARPWCVIHCSSSKVVEKNSNKPTRGFPPHKHMRMPLFSFLA